MGHYNDEKVVETCRRQFIYG